MLERPPKPRMTEPVIVLVDVVFFLLVFFMLISRLDATAPFEVAPPIAVTGSDMPGGGVTVSIAVDGALAVDGVSVAEDDWLQKAQSITADDRTLIRVNSHADAELRHVLPVLAALEKAGLGEVVVVVTPSAEADR